MLDNLSNKMFAQAEQLGRYSARLDLIKIIVNSGLSKKDIIFEINRLLDE